VDVSVRASRVHCGGDRTRAAAEVDDDRLGDPVQQGD
jgi:hypothetical protein